MLGLDAPGKMMVIGKPKFGERATPMPTIYVNSERLNRSGSTI
jgi:hypothetical protein